MLRRLSLVARASRVQMPEPDDDPWPDPDEELPVAAAGALPARKPALPVRPFAAKAGA